MGKDSDNGAENAQEEFSRRIREDFKVVCAEIDAAFEEADGDIGELGELLMIAFARSGLVAGDLSCKINPGSGMGSH